MNINENEHNGRGMLECCLGSDQKGRGQGNPIIISIFQDLYYNEMHEKKPAYAGLSGEAGI